MLARISTLALAYLTAASASQFAARTTPNTAGQKLMSNARPLRQLDNAEEEEAEIDISTHSIMFEKCQFVRSFNEDMAQENGDTVLATDRFIIFKLCNTSTMSSSGCNYDYGEYIVDMDSYLGYMVEYKKEEQEAMCEACEEDCAYYGDDAVEEEDEEEEEEEEDEEDEDEDEDGDERRRRLAAKARFGSRKLADAAAGNSDCSTCIDSCEKIENMEENYYMDATAFVQCAQLNEDMGYWAAPMCGSNGSKIRIGVFTDEDCQYLDSSLDVEDYLADDDGNQYKLSHALLKTTYDNSDPISCLDDEDEDEADDQVDDAEKEVRIKEVCENIYMETGKCETSHGFSPSSSQNGGVQSDNEELTCSFIESLKSGTYSLDGEIVVGGTSSYTPGGTATTGGQKFALTFFILGTVGLAVYAAMLHSQLTKGGKADLSTQGGAMA